jgi:hypothetical protein
MTGRNVSGVVPPGLFEVAQQAVDYEGTSMSSLVSASLALYLGLSGAARRSARYVLSSGSPEARELLLEGCGRAIARAADTQMSAQLAERGRAMGIQDPKLTDEAIEAQAVAAVREARKARRSATRDTDRDPPQVARMGR